MVRNSRISRGRGSKKIKALGEESMHWRIVHLSFEYHIAPAQLMQEDVRMLWTMEKYLYWRRTKENQAQRKR